MLLAWQLLAPPFTETPWERVQGATHPSSNMSSQGHSTASSRSRPWSPRLTVSGGGRSQYSAYTIYSDVESDHNVFAFVPPPVGGAELPIQPPLPELLPVLEDRRPTTAFRPPTSESRPATQNASEERFHPSPPSLGSARGDTTSGGDLDAFNYSPPQQDIAIEPPEPASLNEVPGGFSGDPSVPPQFERKRDLRWDPVDRLT